MRSKGKIIKICNKCKKEKSILCFHKDITRKDGLRSICKECSNAAERERYHKERFREKILKRKRQQYANDRMELGKKYNPRNGNKTDQKEYQRKYKKEVWRNNAKNRISESFSFSIRKSIKDKNGSSWEKVVGYSIEQLIEHLENISDFFIDDYKDGKVHIDHIIPIKAFNFNSRNDKEFKKCWNIKNLRLISAAENRSKKDKINWDLIEEYNLYNILPNQIKIH